MTETPAVIDVKSIKWNDLESLELSTKGKQAIRNYLLNQAPPDVFLKKYNIKGEEILNSTEKGKYQDLPIDKVEYLLTIFFGKWYVEIKTVNQILNSICVTIRLYYLNPDTGEFDWQDGVGASPMQLDSGTKASDLYSVKSNAVKIAAPSAKSEAIKDAADLIGKVFGRDLNRKDTLNYEVLTKNFDNAKIIEK